VLSSRAGRGQGRFCDAAALAGAWNGVGAARADGAISAGHHVSSQAEKRPRKRGMTFSEKRFVLSFASSFPRLPHCQSSIRCPTLRSVATVVSGSTTSSGAPMITEPRSTMASMRVVARASCRACRLAARPIWPCTPARGVASVIHQRDKIRCVSSLPEARPTCSWARAS
jgi:hypothetical protein